MGSSLSHTSLRYSVSIKLFDLFVRDEPNKLNTLVPLINPMASAFPHQPPVTHAPREQTSIVVNRDEPTDVLQVLSSESAQEILSTLTSEPKTASEIATSVDQSVQNVSYHLGRLCNAELVKPIETWYSEKGREMTVYALTTEQLVVRFHDNSE